MTKTDVMKTYIPEFLRNSQVMVSVLNADGTEFDQLNTNLNNILLQFYVETATETGLTLWEQFLGLSSYAGKPLDQRRSRIISKLRGMGTITIEIIKNVAESYVYGHVTVIEDPANYSFTIKFVDPYGVPANLADIKAAINEIKPAHLAVDYEFRYLIWDELDAENLIWDELDAKNLTWDDFETGGWLNA